MSIKITENHRGSGSETPSQKTIEYSSPNGGGLIKFVETNGELWVSFYQQDPTVRVYVEEAR